MLSNGALTGRALRHCSRQPRIFDESDETSSLVIQLVHIFQAYEPIQSLHCEEVTTREPTYGRVIQVVIGVSCHHDDIGDLVCLHTTLLTMLDWTLFAAYTRTLVTAWKKLSAALVAWEAIARSSARQGTRILMLTRPLALLNTGCAWLIAFIRTLVVFATYL
jgi:hypothetical protein